MSLMNKSFSKIINLPAQDLYAYINIALCLIILYLSDNYLIDIFLI